MSWLDQHIPTGSGPLVVCGLLPNALELFVGPSIYHAKEADSNLDLSETIRLLGELPSEEAYTKSMRGTRHITHALMTIQWSCICVRTAG
jgi:hypothetical protein